MPQPFRQLVLKAVGLAKIGEQGFTRMMFRLRADLVAADDIGAAGHQAGSDAPLGDGGKNLLSAATSDAEERFEGGAVDPGVEGRFELADGFGEAVEPERFIGHRVS